jgi:cytochrome P450
MTGTSETWRKGRKLLDGSLRPGAIISYRQMMQEKTYNFLAQLRANPKDFRTHIELSVGHLLCPMVINGWTDFRENLSCHSHMATT